MPGMLGRAGQPPQAIEDLVRGETPTRHLDGVRVLENPLAFEDMHVVAAQNAAVDSFQAIELPVFRLDQRRPVEAGAIDRPAEAVRILELVGIVRAVHQQLLRDAAAHHAGAADPAFLDNGDARAVAAGQPGGAHAAGAGADGDQVVVVLPHR